MNYQKPFTNAEYTRRFGEVKKRMQTAGFEVLLCADPANMCWLTGFDGWSFYTPQCVIVAMDESAPLWFGREQDAKSARITTDLPADNIVGYSEPLVHHSHLHPYDEFCELAISRGWATARIGVEMDAHYYTARAHQHLLIGLPKAFIADNYGLVNWARLVKSDAELVYMREAGRICTEAMNVALNRLQPGVRQFAVIADIYHAQITGYDNKYGDYTSLCPLIQVGEGTSTPHLTWSNEALPNSGLVSIELAAARRHYHAPLTRTAHLGKPPAKISQLAEVIVEGGNVALDAAKPGVTCEEVEAVWQDVLNRNGYSKTSRVGYSIGLNYPPDWGERTASMRPGDTTILQAGMCFHFQSGMWLDDFGAAVSESIVVSEKGGERLCDVRRELIVID